MRSEISGLKTMVADTGAALMSRMDRTERSVREAADDLTTTIKMELLGRVGHFENQVQTKIDQRLDAMDARITSLHAK